MRDRWDFQDKDLFLKLFGPDVYAVGGFVRDILRGIPSEDVDILITRHPLEDIIQKLSPHGSVDVVGKSFGVIKFTTRGKTYDIALPRKDRPKTSRIRSHKDFVIAADPDLPIEKDLNRRDFRCNSMALRLADNQVIDPFDGRKDIEERIIRLTNPRAFPQDPLRVVRAARFASALEFVLEPAIYDLAKNIDLGGLSPERINEELFKILLHSQRPSVGLEEMFRLGALRQLYPELYRLTLSIQDSLFHPEKDPYGHHTVWAHTLIVLDQAKRLADGYRLDAPRSLTLLMASLFHDVGKPETAQWEYKKGRMVITNNGHDVASAKITKNILDRYRIFSWNGYTMRKMILALIKCHHRA
ncbi:MAG: HD domain-containing protein, partial [Candidatus Aminicenantales bacterium]